MYRCCLFFFPLLFPILLFSGEVRTITCDQAVGLMMKNNLDILQAEKDIAIARAQLGQSVADYWLPGVSGSGSFTLSGSENINTGYQTTNISGQDYVIANTYPDNYSAGISVSKTLFNGFQLWNAREIQQKNYEQALWKYRDTIQTNKISAIQSYYQLLVYRQNIRVLEITGKALQDRLDYMTGLYRKGATNEIAYLQALVNYKNNIPKLVQASNTYSGAMRDFRLLIGITNNDSVELAGSVSDMTNGFTNGLSYPVMAENAVSNDSSLHTIELNLETAKLNRSTAELSRLPSLSANFSYRLDYKRDSTSYNFRSWQPSWNGGLSLNVPIEGWLCFSKEAQAISQYAGTVEKLELSKTQRVQNILSQVEKSLVNLKYLQECVDNETENVRLARRQLELSRKQFKQGNTNPLDLQDSEVTCETAELAYWQAFYNYASAALAFRSMTRNGGNQP